MLREKQPSSVLIVSSGKKTTEYLNDLLSPSSFYPVQTAGSCGEAKRLLVTADFDIIIINTPLGDEFGSDFAADLVGNSFSSVILLVSADSYGEVADRVESFGVMAVSKPTSKSFMSGVIKLAVATNARISAIRKKNESLTEKMGEIRIVNRAKWTLISRLGMNEEQAHRYIEKQAMDLRLQKREVAENIIRTYEE